MKCWRWMMKCWWWMMKILWSNVISGDKLCLLIKINITSSSDEEWTEDVRKDHEYMHSTFARNIIHFAERSWIHAHFAERSWIHAHFCWKIMNTCTFLLKDDECMHIFAIIVRHHLFYLIMNHLHVSIIRIIGTMLLPN